MSNQIEMIEKLYAKTKTYKIPEKPRKGVDQLDIEITPLSLEDMGSLNMKEDMPSEEIAKNVTMMVSKSLGITKEQAAKISFEFSADILSAIMDTNNFKDEDLKKTGIKEFIKKKQKQIKEKENAQSNRPA